MEKWYLLPHLDWSLDGIHWHTYVPKEGKEGILYFKGKPVEVEEFYIPPKERRKAAGWAATTLVVLAVVFWVTFFLVTIPFWPLRDRD